jgi:hypothetical protein
MVKFFSSRLKIENNNNNNNNKIIIIKPIFSGLSGVVVSVVCLVRMLLVSPAVLLLIGGGGIEVGGIEVGGIEVGGIEVFFYGDFVTVTYTFIANTAREIAYIRSMPFLHKGYVGEIMIRDGLYIVAVTGMGVLMWMTRFEVFVMNPYYRWVVIPRSKACIEKLMGKLDEIKLRTNIDDGKQGITVVEKLKDDLQVVSKKIELLQRLGREAQVLRVKGKLVDTHYAQFEKVRQEMSSACIDHKIQCRILIEKAEKVYSLSSIYHGMVSLFESVVEFVSRSNSVVFVIGARLFSFGFIVMVEFFSSRLKIENNNNKIIIKSTFSGLTVLVVGLVRMVVCSFTIILLSGCVIDVSGSGGVIVEVGYDDMYFSDPVGGFIGFMRFTRTGWWGWSYRLGQRVPLVSSYGNGGFPQVRLCAVGIGSAITALAWFGYMSMECRYKWRCIEWGVIPESENIKEKLTYKRLQLSGDEKDSGQSRMGVQRKLELVEQKMRKRADFIQEA